MRQFLYLSPYFPPQTQVGALRPLKFVRHLPALGWQPVVLCDLWPGAAQDASLLDLVPAEVIVKRDWSARAAHATKPGGNPSGPPKPAQPPWHERLLPAWLQNPELLPLGEHSVDMPHALRAARRLLRKHPACEAIVVNADPFAAALVGAQLKRETGLPLVLDFRDPWAPCRLRRPRRPRAIRWLEDRLERFAVERADHVILNTRNTLDDYLAHYRDLGPGRFSYLRNHYDPALVATGSHQGFDRYTLLHLGRFTRFRQAGVLMQVLAELARRGVEPADLQLVLTGEPGKAARAEAERLGVQDFLVRHPHVPYREIGAVMQAADLLVLLAEAAATQRIASKLYDYLGATRPLLAITDNPEVREMLQASGAGHMRLHDDIAGIADTIQAEMARGRQREAPRQPIGVTSPEASVRLAEVLASVTATR